MARNIATPAGKKGNAGAKRSQKKESGRKKSRVPKHWPQNNLLHTKGIYRQAVKRLVESSLGAAFHHKQLLSIFMIVFGIINSTQLSIAAVGTAMARVFGKSPKHGKKQVDRCLSNEKLSLKKLFQCSVPLIIGNRRDIVVTMDWTEFDKDNHSMVCISLVTRAKRTQPLVWLTVEKSGLKGKQRNYERKALKMLYDVLPKKTAVMVLADRGFGDVKLYHYIHRTLGFHFVIRYRQSIYVEQNGWLEASANLVFRNGRIRVIRETTLTAAEAGPYTVVLYKAAGMKEPWCLATSLHDATGRGIVDWYSRRFQCEETFRDLKDRRYGYGLRFTKITDCQRRDRMLFLFVIAYLIFTLMGATSEQLGLDKKLRSNTEQRRTHSLFRQGIALYGCFVKEIHDAIACSFNGRLQKLFMKGVLEVVS
jgi:hypothetical protein